MVDILAFPGTVNAYRWRSNRPYRGTTLRAVVRLKESGQAAYGALTSRAARRLAFELLKIAGEIESEEVPRR